MRRPRRLGQGRAPGMAQQARQFGRRFDRAGKLRHRREERRVRNFLVRIAVLERRLLAAAEGDHRAAAEPRVLQTRGQVGGTDRLRHAHARPPGDAGIAVGHVGRGLLRVGEDRPHPEIAQVQQGAAQRRLDEEDMAHPGPGQGPRQPFGAVHRGCFAHAVSSVLTIHMRFSRSVCVRDQATTRLVEFLTRAKLVPLGIVNHHRFDGTIETPSLMEICRAIGWLC